MPLSASVTTATVASPSALATNYVRGSATKKPSGGDAETSSSESEVIAKAKLGDRALYPAMCALAT
jgi:hypothetical protein